MEKEQKEDRMNNFNTRVAIGTLLNDEKELETKLELLTEISLATRNVKTVEICEEYRFLLCDEESTSKGHDILHLAIAKYDGDRNSGNEESNEVYGGES
jgi:hypothetical protein